MKKGEISVRSAVRMAFVMLPDQFTALQIVNRVRQIVAPYYPLDGNILRRLREVRDAEPHIFGYTYNSRLFDGYYEKTAKN